MRAIDIPAALLVATASLCCSVVVGCAFLLAVLAVGDTDVAPRGDWAGWSVAAALACAHVAALIALTRAAGGLRPAALCAAWALAFAWPLSGVPVPGALIATLGTGLVVLWGGDRSGERPGTDAAALLAAVTLWLLTAAVLVGGPADVAAVEPERRAAAPPDRVAPAEPAETRHSPAARTPVPVVAPVDTVRAYYRALDRRDFTRAWRTLSPTVRAGFGGFATWRAGYAATQSSRPSALRRDASGDEAVVEHVLTARDRAPCGVLVQRFTVRWRLLRAGGAWRAIALSAQPLAAPACS